MSSKQDIEVLRGRISELKQLEPPEQYENYARLAGQEACTICGFNAVKFRRHIKEKIELLEKEIATIKRGKPMDASDDVPYGEPDK